MDRRKAELTGAKQWRIMICYMQKRGALNVCFDIMRRLRDPETGCPWDIEQAFRLNRPLYD